MKKCCFCNQSFNGGNKHIYTCKKKPENLIDKIEIKYEYIKYNFPEISKKEILVELYINKLHSLPDIKKIYNIDFKSILFLLEYFEIPKRNISESSIKISQDKYRKTCLKKYGTENALSKGSPITIKRNKTVKDRYGVDNIFQAEHIKEKLNNTMIERYGSQRVSCNINGNKTKWLSTISKEDRSIMLKPWYEGFKKWRNNLSDVEMEIYIQKLFNNWSFTSSLETRMKTILDKMGIEYYHQFFVKRRSYDFKIKKTKILIEINGDYWHANPKKYLENDIIINKQLAKDIWEKDKQKTELAINNGFYVIKIWEDEMSKLSDEELALLLLNKINEIDYVTAK